MVSWSVYAAGLLTRTAATSSAHIHLVSDAGSTAGACIAAGRSGTAGIGVSGWTTAGGRGGGGIVGCMRGMVTVTCLTVAGGGGGGAAGRWITGAGGVSTC